MTDGLGPTLRAWRDRLPVSATGLPAHHGRRAAGLRREELAALAGLSVDYVVRLEQGRATTPSSQVVGALARALQLDPEERDHLHRLAGLAVPSAGLVPRSLSPGVQRQLCRLGEVAVAAFAADWQLLWWNAVWASALGDPGRLPPAERSFARATFLGGPHGLAAWPVTTADPAQTRAAVVADLRRATGTYPHDPALAALVTDLRSGSSEFAALWAAAAVGVHRSDRKTVQHPLVGPVALDCDTLAADSGDVKVVVMSAAAGSADEERLRLAVLAGVPA